MDTFVDYDPILVGVGPSNPWMSDDATFWEINKPMWVLELVIQVNPNHIGGGANWALRRKNLWKVHVFLP